MSFRPWTDPCYRCGPYRWNIDGRAAGRDGGSGPAIPISRRTIALHSTNRAASSATNRLTASVSPAINPVTSTATATNRAASSATNRLTASVSPAINPAMSTATATNRAASTVTSPPMASANSATNPATSTATATSRAANMATSPPTVNVSSGIRNTATVNSATNPISRGRGSTTTNRRPTRNSRPKSRSAKCA